MTWSTDTRSKWMMPVMCWRPDCVRIDDWLAVDQRGRRRLLADGIIELAANIFGAIRESQLALIDVFGHATRTSAAHTL